MAPAIAGPGGPGRSVVWPFVQDGRPHGPLKLLPIRETDVPGARTHTATIREQMGPLWDPSEVVQALRVQYRPVIELLHDAVWVHRAAHPGPRLIAAG